MSSAGPGLAFEQPIFELEQELETLESEETGNGQSAKVRDLKRRLRQSFSLGNGTGRSTPKPSLYTRLFKSRI